MKNVKSVVCRYLTNTDYYNMYKTADSEDLGGGQTYIDFPISTGVSLEDWNLFFENIQGLSRPEEYRWVTPVHSIGSDQSQNVTIYRRREPTISISSQRIGSRNSNRVYAWHPDNGFPSPVDPNDRNAKPENLVIFIVSTYEGEIWAGWTFENIPARDQITQEALNDIFPPDPRIGYSNCIHFEPNTLMIDETDSDSPFYSIGHVVASNRRDRSEEEINDNFFLEDALDLSDSPLEEIEVIHTIRARNQRAVRVLKQLYEGNCQLTGDRLTFRKRDGTRYSEAHHLIPLGEEGADSPHNIIVVSPLIHRMLHFAEVSDFDLSQMQLDNTLEIIINGEAYVITWHPDHANTVRRFQEEN